MSSVSFLCSAFFILSLFDKTTRAEVIRCNGHIDGDLNDVISKTCILDELVARSKLHCAKSCQQHPTCLSFFFVASSGFCQLHVDILSKQDVTYSMEGSKYYTLCRDRYSKAFDCRDLLTMGFTTSGICKIHPYGNSTSHDVFCDQTRNGGGWLLFQRRVDGTEDFYRTWNEYRDGFGTVDGEFWLGLDLLHLITSNKTYELRVDLEDFNSNVAYAEYDAFSVSDSSTQFVLYLGAYSGDAGDSLKRLSGGSMVHDRSPFSTKDRDNSGCNCAVKYKSGFWHGNKVMCHCHFANPNGLYLNGPNNLFGQGMEWDQWTGRKYSVKRTEMKIRPTDN